MTESTRLDAVYQAQKHRLTQIVVRAAAATLTTPSSATEQAVTIQRIVPVVAAGQGTMVRLVGAYMGAKSLQAGAPNVAITLDPARYTTGALRGVNPDDVYQRPFAVMQATLARTGDEQQALQSGRAQAAKLAATDMQLAQTHAAHDWMAQAPTVVGYRRVLTGAGPHCPLCEQAATRTYRKQDLMPIHEHCTCTVEPLWGTEPVASVGTTVRVEEDPELGPRLMADSWSQVGPRLTD